MRKTAQRAAQQAAKQGRLLYIRFAGALQAPARRAGRGQVCGSGGRIGETGEGDLVDVLESEAPDGVEEKGEVSGRGHQGHGDVQGGDEVLPEDLFARSMGKSTKALQSCLELRTALVQVGSQGGRRRGRRVRA
jgi:hypothetical protein